MIARVQPLTTTRRLAGPFDYALPGEPVEVGSIVRVPFGRQALDGVVVGLADRTDVPPEKLVTPTGGARRTRVPRELVDLALWMAGEYCSTPARALSLVLPPKGRPRTELWAARTDAPLDGQRLTARQAALLGDAAARGGAASCRRCGGWRRAGSSRSRRGRGGGRRSPCRTPTPRCG